MTLFSAKRVAVSMCIFVTGVEGSSFLRGSTNNRVSSFFKKPVSSFFQKKNKTTEGRKEAFEKYLSKEVPTALQHELLKQIVAQSAEDLKRHNEHMAEQQKMMQDMVALLEESDESEEVASAQPAEQKSVLVNALGRRNQKLSSLAETVARMDEKAAAFAENARQVRKRAETGSKKWSFW